MEKCIRRIREELESTRSNGQKNQKEAEILKSNVEKAGQDGICEWIISEKNLHTMKKKRLSARLWAALESRQKT